MFSTTQLDTLEGLVTVMRNEGYKYYVAVTDNNRTTNYNPDLYIYFSKEEIYSSEDYVFFIPSDSIKFSIRTSNSSTNNNTDRISKELLSSSEFLRVDEAEFCSTNASYTESILVQPDFIKTEVVGYEIQGALLLTVCSFLFFMFFVKLFRR